MPDPTTKERRIIVVDGTPQVYEAMPHAFVEKERFFRDAGIRFRMYTEEEFRAAEAAMREADS